jgi:hypothetical protein
MQHTLIKEKEELLFSCSTPVYFFLQGSHLKTYGWMQLVDIVLNEVSQAQKDTGRMCSLIHGRQIQR